MSKEDVISVPGKVIEVLPNTLFQVEIEGGHKILAHLAGKLRVHHIRIVAGDTITVEFSLYDLTKGRITSRFKREAA